MAVHVESHMLPGLVPPFLLKVAQIDCFMIPHRGSPLHHCKGHNCQTAREHPSFQGVYRVPCMSAIMAGCHGYDCGDTSWDHSPLGEFLESKREGMLFSKDSTAR